MLVLFGLGALFVLLDGFAAGAGAGVEEFVVGIEVLLLEEDELAAGVAFCLSAPEV